ncbi:MAG: undecaprenyl/decaprenyl-phosphate alpha-N-acetylglucosaminyl 1-phosphate transferase [Rhodospirillales bacterium]|jgi:UDP-GlcNAc:undecaprenyl-phosphate GlcNAc-1-phosphate transferase|nr:undecaprenyl/decaprenyl-phosphate alpha-N-acetylglucosaminyl 1-phosphate transferase [Rhodospirillales bacterium]
MAYVLTLAVSLFVAMALIPPLARFAGRLRLEDIPDARKLHARPIPRVGGIAIIIGVATAVLLWVPFDRWIVGYLVGVIVISLFGVWDDRSDLDYRLKFLGQFLAAGAVVGIGGVHISFLPLLDGWVLPPALAMPLTIFVLVAITNAINLTDGLDGLAGGTTLLAVACIALLSYLDDDQTLLIISLGLIGALFGFLRYNSYPARVFLGDTGSQFLGFSAAVLAIDLTQTSNTALSPALPLLLLGLPILDTLVVMTQRMLEGRSPFKPDRTHLHHRLLSVGLDHYEAVLLIYAIQTLLICSAFFFRFEHDSVLIGIYLALSAVIVIPLLVMRQRGWTVRRPAVDDHFLARAAAVLEERRTLKRVPLMFIGVAVPGLLLFSAAGCEHVSPDLGMAAAGCLLLMAMTLIVPSFGQGVVDRLAVYTTASFAVFLMATQVPLADAGTKALPIFYGVLACAVAATVRFSDGRNFSVSSLDFLVIVVVVLLTLVAGAAEADPVFVKIALQLVVVFYACEMLMVHAAVYWRVVKIASAAALCVFAARALLA